MSWIIIVDVLFAICLYGSCRLLLNAYNRYRHKEPLTCEEILRTAIHEAGHAITAWHQASVQKIVAVAVYQNKIWNNEEKTFCRGECRYLIHDPILEQDGPTLTAIMWYQQMVVALGGEMATRTLLNDQNPCWSSYPDTEKARKLAEKISKIYASSAIIPPDQKHHFSAERIFELAEKTALEIVRTNQDKLLDLVDVLINLGVVYSSGLDIILGKRPGRQ